MDRAANEHALHVASLRADVQRLTKSQAAVVAHLQAASRPPPSPPSPPQPYTRTNPGPAAAQSGGGLPSGFAYADVAAPQQPQRLAATATAPVAATGRRPSTPQARSPQQGSPQQGSPQQGESGSPQQGSPQQGSPGLQDVALWQDDSKAWQQKHKALAAELGLTPAGMRQNVAGGVVAWGSLEC